VEIEAGEKETTLAAGGVISMPEACGFQVWCGATRSSSSSGPVVLHVAADDGAVEDIESGEQLGRAVTFVVVGLADGGSTALQLPVTHVMTRNVSTCDVNESIGNVAQRNWTVTAAEMR
jgi:hypothetical protein